MHFLAALSRWFRREPPAAVAPVASAPPAPREALHAFLLRHTDPQTQRLRDSMLDLPDAAWLFAPGETPWIAGGRDGVLVQHATPQAHDERAAQIAAHVGALRDEPSAEMKAKLQELIASRRS